MTGSAQNCLWYLLTLTLNIFVFAAALQLTVSVYFLSLVYFVLY